MRLLRARMLLLLFSLCAAATLHVVNGNAALISSHRQALELVAQKDLKQALSATTAILHQNPMFAPSVMLRAHILFRLGREDEGVEMLDFALAKLNSAALESATYELEMVVSDGVYSRLPEVRMIEALLLGLHGMRIRNSQTPDELRTTQHQLAARYRELTRSLTKPSQRQIAWLNLANTLADLDEHEEASVAYAECAAIAPAVMCHVNRAQVLRLMGDAGAQDHELIQALRLRPLHFKALCRMLTARQPVQWGPRWRYANRLIKALVRKEPYESSFRCLTASGSIYTALDLEERMLVASRECGDTERQLAPSREEYVARNAGTGDDDATVALETESADTAASLPWRPSPWWWQKNKLGYVATSMHLTIPPPEPSYFLVPLGRRLRIGWVYHTPEDPAPVLFHAMWQHEDRHRFEWWAFIDGRDGGDSMVNMLENSAQHYVDVTGQTALSTSHRINHARIDVLLDLKGLHSRWAPVISASRPTRVSVNLIGFLATTGSLFYHLTFTDKIAVPPEHAPFYTEKLMIGPPSFFPQSHTYLYMPAAFEPSELCSQYGDDGVGQEQRRKRMTEGTRIEMGPPLRVPDDDMGLDAHAIWSTVVEKNQVAFSNFNRLVKIDGATFDAWLQMLAKAPNSHLFLAAYSPQDVELVEKRVASTDLNMTRITVMNREGMHFHMHRLKYTDITLDAFTLNAHTTGADSLFLAVPVLHCPSDTWSGRVGASLLTGAGLTEMIVRTQEEYVDLGAQLANNPALLRSIRCTLAEKRGDKSAEWMRALQAGLRMQWDTLMYRGDHMHTIVSEAATLVSSTGGGGDLVNSEKGSRANEDSGKSGLGGLFAGFW